MYLYNCLRTYNCDVRGLGEIHSNIMSTTEAQTPEQDITQLERCTDQCRTQGLIRFAYRLCQTFNFVCYHLIAWKSFENGFVACPQ